MNINVEIKNHFAMNKRKRVKQGIKPGNSKSHWRAVTVAKDQNNDEMPVSMFKDGVQLNNNELSDHFANYFGEKINTLTSSVVISNEVYNGERKINSNEKNFIRRENIMEAVKLIKIKNSEGHDGIPQRMMVDGISLLFCPPEVFTTKFI